MRKPDETTYEYIYRLSSETEDAFDDVSGVISRCKYPSSNLSGTVLEATALLHKANVLLAELTAAAVAADKEDYEPTGGAA